MRPILTRNTRRPSKTPHQRNNILAVSFLQISVLTSSTINDALKILRKWITFHSPFVSCTCFSEYHAVPKLSQLCFRK